MQKITICFCALFLTVIVSGLDVKGQKKTDYWLNLPSCPLKIHDDQYRLPLNQLFLENIAAAEITGFQLGCLIEDGNNIKIFSKHNKVDAEIKPAGNIDNKYFMPTSAHGNYLQTRCGLPQKVGVIEVNFADGGIWKIKE